MEATVNYLIQSGLALLVLYLFYRIVLRNQPSLWYNRLYLLLAPLLALLIPMLQLPLPIQTVLTPGEVMPAIQLQEIQVTGYAAEATASMRMFTIGQVLLGLYTAIGLLLLIRLGVQIVRIKRLATTATTLPSPAPEASLLQTEGQLPAFAFLNYVFLGTLSHLSEKERQQIISHELAHVRLRHTYDILYYEVLTAVLWFNPLVWLLKEELRDVHEFQADAQVLADHQPQEYSSLLAKEALYVAGIPVGSYFQKPQVFRRLQMLQQHGRPAGWLRPLLALPVLLLLLFAFADNTATANTGITAEESSSLAELLVTAPARKAGIPLSRPSGIASESDKATTSAQPVTTPATSKKVTTVEPASTPSEAASSDKSKPYTYVEQMPQFKGGEGEMLKFLGKNIRYPKAAQEAGVEGLVVISFIVEADGSLHEISVLKKLHDDADAEAVRVVESMNGQWSAGKQNGIEVPVRYTLPIRFAMK